MAETELWLVDLDKTAAALDAIEEATPRLSEDFRRRIDGMSDEAARRERRLTHIALRILLERRLGVGMRGQPFVTNAAGKPSLAAREVGFSLSHTTGLALIAIGADPLGVDIEQMRKVRIPERRRVPIELEAVTLAGGVALPATMPEARFLSAWVRIEAVAKARGTGVGPMLERMRPESHSAAPVQGELRGELPSIVAHDVPITEGIFAAVALAAGEKPPLLRLLPETTKGIVTLLGVEGGTRR